MPPPEPADETTPLGEDRMLDDDRLDEGMLAAFANDPDFPAAADAYRSIVQIVGEGAGAVSRVSLPDIDDEPSPLHRPASGPQDLPQQIGRYRIAGEIARGGVGSIYKARDEDLGRDIALKVLLGDYRENADMTRRFMEEAQIGGQLQHPGIVPVHEMGLVSGKHPYFAMKLVKGRTLARLLEARKDPADERQHFLGIFEQICQPLAYAHARGVIHRDLKPSNVMVGAFGEVQVMDWGLAKVLSRDGVADHRRDVENHKKVSVIQTVRSGSTGSESLAGSVLGTPAYMAPEQARGEVDDLDERSDVFGLGAILCEILTGNAPYVAATSKELLSQAKKGYLEDAMARIDACGADREMVELAKRCFAFEPRERPRDAGAVMKAVRDYLESLEERARTTKIKAAKASMRLTVALVVVIAFSLGAGAMVWLAKERRDREAQLAEEQRKRKERATAAVASVVSEARALRAAASAGDPADHKAWSYAFDTIQRAERLTTDEVDEKTRRALADEKSAIEAGLAKSRMRSDLEDLRDIPLEVYDPSMHQLDSGYKKAFEQFLGVDVEAMELDDAVNLIRTHVMRAELLVALREWTQVRYLVTLEGGGEWWKRAEELSKTQLVQVQFRSDSSRTRERLSQFESSRTRLKVDDPLFVDVMNAQETARLVVFAQAVSMRRDFAAADFCLRIALRREPGNYRVHHALSRLLRRQGKLDEALHHALIARSLRPERPRPWSSLGLAQEETGDYDGALEAYTRAAVLEPTEAKFYQQLRALVEREGRPGFGDEALERTVSSLTQLLASGRPVSPEARPVLDLLLYGSIDESLNAPEPLIEEGAIWRVFAASAKPSPGLEWATPEFDDCAWFQGVSGFGYEDGDDATVLGGMRDDHSSVYIRRLLQVPDVARFRRLELSLRVDDGCVVYLNGKLLGRLRVSPDGVVASAPEPLVAEILEIPLEDLREGRNLVAIEGLNSSLGSSDFSLIPVVRGELAPQAARERDRELLEDFRERVFGPHAEARLAYFEGRVLQRSGQHEQARVKFLQALRADPGSARISVALQENLLGAKHLEGVAAELRELFARSEFLAPRFWDTGLRTALAEREWTPAQILALLPPEETGSDWNEIRRFLERLRGGETIRLNCGGKEYVSPSGAVWGRDRFFSGGRLFLDGERDFEGDIRGTEDDSIYATERWFPPPPAPPAAYRVPLPAGDYRVTLHFAEIFLKLQGERVFSVAIEGKEVLSSYSPAASAGTAAADVKHFDVRVDDRVLDIEFLHESGNPKISGIEIRVD